MDYSLGYREVIPDQTLQDKWKEITLTTGGSSLQEIKVPERAGGYCYKDSSKYFTRNRFIYWRIYHDVLELVENSLDINLANNRVRYKFTDTPLLDGISIYEIANSVIILIATVSSIHKFSFPHPDKIHKQNQLFPSSADFVLQSIFSEATIQNARDPHTFHVIPTSNSTSSPAHAAASCLIHPQEEALFALAYSSGIILLLRLDSVTGFVHTTELKQESIVPRFFSGIATAIRGRSEVEVVSSLVLQQHGNDVHLYSLYREGNLRMWSCTKAQCVTVLDLIENHRQSNIQNHLLKKTVDSNNELFLCTYLKFDDRSEFCVFKLLKNPFKLTRVCTLVAPNQHLVDFSFTETRLWAVWRTDIDSIVINHALLPIKNCQISSKWDTAVLVQHPDEKCLMNESDVDPRQSYINYIFYPGRFSSFDIIRALSIYQRSNFSGDINIPLAELKKKVCVQLELEIQSEVKDYELMDEEYLEIVNRCWSKFYSCVLQYHLNGSRPVGLLLLPNVHGTIVLKKSSFSLLRPMEALEHLILCNDKSYTAQFKTTPILCQDEKICQDLVTLMSTLLILEEHLSDDLKYTFEKELNQLKSPDVVVENLLPKLFFETDEYFSDYDFQSELYHRLENIKDITSAMAMLLEALTYDLGQPDKLELTSNHNKLPDKSNLNYFFGSQLGISALSEVIKQIATTRFSICRNLLLLQQIVLSRSEFFDSKSLHSVKSSIAPKTVVLTQAYYVLLWVCETNTSVTSSEALIETARQRLSLLKPSENRTNLDQRKLRSYSLLELFIQYGAKQFAHKLVDTTNIDSSNLVYWHSGMLSYATLIAQLIWPISENFYFPEWLLFSCQFLLVQEYVRLLSTWCEWNSASRKFILAVSFLELGEPQKACDNFLQASNGIFSDHYLSHLLLPSELSSGSDALVCYFLKIIRLCEQYNALDCIVELAITALTVAEEENPDLPTLHSIVFMQHLNLQHYIEAYNCLNTNPDAARRIDCLRQLVTTLFNNKKLKELVSFPYVDMHQDLEKIIESRARSVNSMENGYYDFLYSFHINKGNVRKAASVMYEQALRLSQEPHTLGIISKQTYCLLACINALHLVNEKYRWIVRPAIDVHFSEKQYDYEDRRNGISDDTSMHKVKKQIEVLELKDIEKEYILAEAKLKLAELNHDSYLTAQTHPLEIVAIMCNSGLYVQALNVCEHLELCKATVLESLASQCARINSKDNASSWDWLSQNNIFDLGLSTLNTTEIAWKLLEHLTLKHEKEGESKLHKGVAKKLYHHDAFLPEWLYYSFAKRNAPEFLRLMVFMGRLEEAAHFSLKYIRAAMRNDKTFFADNTTSLLPTSSSTYLPFDCLEILLIELENLSKEDKTYTEIYETLKKTMEEYLKKVERVSESMVQFAQNK